MPTETTSPRSSMSPAQRRRVSSLIKQAKDALDLMSSECLNLDVHSRNALDEARQAVATLDFLACLQPQQRSMSTGNRNQCPQVGDRITRHNQVLVITAVTAAEVCFTVTKPDGEEWQETCPLERWKNALAKTLAVKGTVYFAKGDAQ